MTQSDPAASDLSSIFFKMGGLLLSEETVQSALDLVCSLAHATLAGTSGAGVTLVRQNSRRTAAYSDEMVKRADALQYDLDEGPCLSAWKDKMTYRIDNMADEKRWPRWCPAAAGMGMGSSLSIPLLVRGEALGAVKVYSAQARNFDTGDEQILSMFADQAALVLVNVQTYTEAQEFAQQLKEALLNRDVTGEARGILMERETVDDEKAFTLLRQISQEKNMKLRDVARELVEEKNRQATRSYQGSSLDERSFRP